VGYRPKAMPMTDVAWVNKVHKPRWDRISTSFRICIWPRKCHSCKKNIWLTKAYRVRHSTPSYNDEYYDDDRWYSKEEYIKLRLMG
jgi:hypothetical protein